MPTMTDLFRFLALLPLTLAFAPSRAADWQPEPADGSVGPFPAPSRPVAHIVSSRWSTEAARDAVGEAGQVMQKAGIRPGMTVADIGAGEGYYTVRIAKRIGQRGHVLAEDIDDQASAALARRVSTERLNNVTVLLGRPADPKLPAASVDRVLLVHMYHEIQQPYEFLWRLRPSLRVNGEIAVVDANRPTEYHGTPPALLRCEFGSVGYRLISLEDVPSAGGYLARFRPVGPRPSPAAIKPCLPLH